MHTGACISCTITGIAYAVTMDRADRQPPPARPGAGPPRAFYAAALLAGIGLGNVSVALPLLVVVRGGSPAIAGYLLAAFTLAVALGALASGPLVSALGARNVLVTGFVVLGCGQVAALAAGAAVAGLALAAVLVGAGLGCFWVGSQVTLGHRAGGAGAERGFVRHYVAYVIGSAAGAPATGLVAQGLRDAGISEAASVRLAFGLGLAAALAGLAWWRPSRQRTERVAPTRRVRPAMAAHGMALQLPDLLLVAALALLAPLAPVILVRDFRFSSVAVGAVVGALAGAKVIGSLTAERASRRLGRGRLVAAMLACASAFSVMLAQTRLATLFVVLLFAAVLAAAGAWPVVVEGALARVDPHQRGVMTVAWNAREYSIIAIATAAAGWLLARFADPAAPFVIAGALLALSAMASHVVLRRPVHAPAVPVPVPVPGGGQRGSAALRRRRSPRAGAGRRRS